MYVQNNGKKLEWTEDNELFFVSMALKVGGWLKEVLTPFKEALDNFTLK
jgi:hypothetical protein